MVRNIIKGKKIFGRKAVSDFMSCHQIAHIS